jgi:hypothetical protein
MTSIQGNLTMHRLVCTDAQHSQLACTSDAEASETGIPEAHKRACNRHQGPVHTLKAASTKSRSCCFLSPWMAEAPNSRFRFHASWSHMRLVEQKIKIRVPRGKDLRTQQYEVM